MPQILDLGEHGIHEVPDDLTPDEIQSFADSFSPAPEVPLDYPKAAIGSTFAAPQPNPEERIISPNLMPTRRNWAEQVFNATPEPPTFSADPIAAAGGALQKAGDVIYEGGVNAIANRLPEFYNDPNEIAQSYDTEAAIHSYPKPVQAFIRGGEGLARSIPQMAVAAVNPVAGATAFGLTPEGFDPKAFSIALALPILGTKTGAVAENIASKLGISSNQALLAINKMGGIGAAAGLITADEAYRISQLPKEQQEQAWVDAAGNIGSQFLLGGIGHTERGSKVGKASEALGKFAESIDTAPIQGKLSPQQAAEVRLGLPPRAATPEMLPQLKRTKELVDQAIQEATQKIQVPGQVPALELLKRQTQNLEEAPARVQKPETGFERPAEEVMRGRTVAEKPSTKEVSNAVVEETAQPVQPVREEPVKVKTEMPSEVGGRPADEGGGKASAEVKLPDVESMTPESFFETASRWSKESMSSPDGISPQIRAELAAKETPDVAAWESARNKAVADVDAIKSELKSNPSVMADPSFQKRWSGAAQKTQFFGEGLDVLTGKKAFNERTEKIWAESQKKAESPIEINAPKDSALGQAISKIEEWQKNLRKPSSEGGLQMGVPKAVLDLGLETVRLTLKAGKSISEAVEAGIKKIYDSLDEAGRKSFDENALRKQLNSTIGVQSPEGMKPRSFSERAAQSEMVPEDVQTQIKTDERSSYEPQKVSDVQERVDKMTDAELGSLTPESEDYTLGKAALANRLFKAGNKEAGLNVIQEASETLTRLGQLINQAKVLNAVRPEYAADVVNAKLEKMGKDPLRPEVAEKITKLSEKKVKAQDELDVAVNEWKNNPTDENAKIAQDKLAASEKAQLALQEETLKWTSNRSIWKKLKKILQGNLLTPVSQVVNVASYFSLNPFEAASRTGASAIDFLENKMMGTQRVSSVSPIGGTIETIKGLGRGAAKIPSIMTKGSSGVVLGESSVSMNPLKAWMRQFASQSDIPTEGGKLTLKDRADLFLEGTFGMPAEVMLRGLGALDSAVKESQRARVIAEQLRLKKVPQNQWDMAMKFPEKFFDKKTLEYIENESASAVLQRDSKSINAINSFLNKQHPAVDFAVATVAPYKLTPWNYLGKLFSYNPAVAISRGLYEASKSYSFNEKAQIELGKGNEAKSQSYRDDANAHRKQANEYAARALIGGTVATAAYYLYKYGMVTPSLDKSDEQQKARVLTGDVMPPNHVNISALGRVMSRLSKGEKPIKEDYDFRKGDETKNSFRLGGITGGMIYMMANIGRAQERKPETGNLEFAQQALKQSTLEQANFALNQSFLSGVEGLLTAVKQGDENDSYLKQYSKTLLSIPLPNTLSSVGRSMRDYKPDYNADTINKKIENVVRERLSAFGTTKGLPIKRDLWGEPMRETPKDANPLVYHLFSITKGQQVTDDPKSLELFRLWRATDNSRIIPTPPKQQFDYNGENYQVPAELMDRYSELVGKERAAIVDKFVTNPNWNKLSNDEKVDELEWAYKKGMKYGKDQFWDEHEKELKKKQIKAGFQIP